MMTKKYYIRFAGIFLAAKPFADSGGAWDLWNGLVRESARVFADDNPSFDRLQFLTACGALAAGEQYEH